MMTIKRITKMWLVSLLGLSLLGLTSAQAGGGGAGGGGGRGGGGGAGGGGFGGAGGRGGAGGTSSSSTYPNNVSPGAVYVTSDLNTGTVVVMTDSNTIPRVQQLIASMDVPQQQVLIKCVFLQVSHLNDSDIGLEGGTIAKYGGIPLTATFTNAFGLASQGSLPAAGLATSGQGIYSVLGKDFTGTLRMIAQANKATILSRPSVLVMNNQPAVIQIGQRVPIITGSTIAATTGQVNNQVSWESLGIILRVVPIINGRVIELIVSPQLSSLNFSVTVPIASNNNGTPINSPTIDITTADTVVITPDGQPVVIGGLIRHDNETGDSKIPIVGDIPLIGNLFKRHQAHKQQNELIIFLTPEIIDTPADLYAMSRREVSDTTLAPKSVSKDEVEKILDGFPLQQPKASGKH